MIPFERTAGLAVTTRLLTGPQKKRINEASAQLKGLQFRWTPFRIAGVWDS